MPAHKKPVNTSRSETVTVRLDPKLRYLAEIASREGQRTLSSFIEWCVRRVLTEHEVVDEPDYGNHFNGERQTPPMWGEGFWDVDEADRFYLLAYRRPDLLTIPEQRIWKLLYGSMMLADGEPTIERFREYWNTPSLNTSHLKDQPNESGE